MKRQEIEKLFNIFRKSENIKKEWFKKELIDYLLKTHITIEEMERVDELLKSF